jgi:UDP-N-acetylmuramyl pentapeptide phosphotransferase/UDP-N-acetylglucosamine-1-phosphate transferase
MMPAPLVILGLVAGWALGRWAAPQLLALLAATNLARVNYRRRTLVAGLGLALPLGLLVWAGLLALVGITMPSFYSRFELAGVAAGAAALAAGVAFCFLGLVDDLVEDQGSRGFRGHLAALARGRLTGGAVKLLGGMLTAVVVAPLAGPPGRSWWVTLLAAVVIASAANVANLLDLRPGRCLKVFLPLWLAGWAAAPHRAPWTAGLAGAAAAVLPLDLREEGMLGDSGANALGAVVGVLLGAGPTWLVVLAAVVLVALQALSERVSFTRVIERNRLLRAADQLGRRAD